jgi:hypothetical protein
LWGKFGSFSDMVRRFVAWMTLCAVATLSLTLTPAGAVRADWTLLSQTPVAPLQHGEARIAVTLSAPAGAHHIHATVYGPVTSRSQLAGVLNGTGLRGASLATSSAALTCTATLHLALWLGGGSPGAHPCTAQPWSLPLPCVAGGCAGVYPLHLTLSGATGDVWTLVTLVGAKPGPPLHVSWISDVDAQAVNNPSLSASTLRVFARATTTPLSFTADYRVFSVLNQMPGTPLHRTLGTTLANPLHTLVNAPPSTVDLGGLVTHGFSSQVTRQLSASSTLGSDMFGRVTTGVQVLSAPPTTDTLTALSTHGATDIVLPDTALSSSRVSSTSWGLPFHPTSAPEISAIVCDGPLSHLLAKTLPPAQRVALVMGTLHVLQQSQGAAHRTVVLETPLSATSPALASQLLSSWQHDRAVAVTPLDSAFASSLIGADGADATASFVETSPSVWSPRNVATLQVAIHNTDSFTSAISSEVMAQALQVGLLQSEITGTPEARQGAISRAQSTLATQLSQFRIDTNPVTLAGAGTSLPITIYSRAPYTVTAVVRLITDRITFPKGHEIAVTMSAPTTSLRVPTGANRGANVTLQVELVTPNGAVVLSRAAVLVTVTGGSIVGWFITAMALLVLAAWWWRSYRRKSA